MKKVLLVIMCMLALQASAQSTIRNVDELQQSLVDSIRANCINSNGDIELVCVIGCGESGKNDIYNAIKSYLTGILKDSNHAIKNDDKEGGDIIVNCNIPDLNRWKVNLGMVLIELSASTSMHFQIKEGRYRFTFTMRDWIFDEHFTPFNRDEQKISETAPVGSLEKIKGIKYKAKAERFIRPLNLLYNYYISVPGKISENLKKNIDNDDW